MLARSGASEAVTIGDAFARKVLASRQVWTVSGTDGLARMPSSNRPGREVTLCWSSPEAAERWSLRAARNPRVNPIQLANFVGEVLPKLRALNRLVSPDWAAEPFHPEFEPGQLELRLRNEGVNRFCMAALASRRVFILEDEIGSAFAASASEANKLMLPVWLAFDDAEMHIRGFWSEMSVSGLPLAHFIEKTLPAIADMGRSISLDHGLGGPLLEMSAPDLSARLMRGIGLRRAG